MKGYWKRNRGGVDLEHELRANRPEPRDELVHKLEANIRGAGRARGSLRLAMGAAVTAVVFALASFGGLGYAAAAVGNVADTAKRVVTPSKPTTIFKSAAQNQYGKPKKDVKAKKKAKRKKARKAKPRFTGGVKGRIARPRFTG